MKIIINFILYYIPTKISLSDNSNRFTATIQVSHVFAGNPRIFLEQIKVLLGLNPLLKAVASALWSSPQRCYTIYTASVPY